jgi:pyridoxamine 5'-phosphate oxidase
MTRIEYGKLTLAKKTLSLDPLEQFMHWWHGARQDKSITYNAANLATVDALGRPDARMVLVQADSDAIVFYSNYKSAKAQQLEQNPHAALTFFWPHHERQVRIRGIISKSSYDFSQKYFHKRPKEAQISAWASSQSSVISSRAKLEEAFATVKEKFSHQEIPCPKHWGGYKVEPFYFEFWQGRAYRLHDRFAYSLDENKKWVIKRLAP